RAAPVRALAALSLVRPRRPDLLRIRVGDPAAGDGIPGHLPRAHPAGRAFRAAHAPLAHRDRAAALADLPRDAGRRPHQAARGPVLARPHLHGLPLRDAADPEPALLVPPPPAALVPPPGGRLQPRGGVDRALLRLRAPAGAARGGGVHRGLPGAAP